MSDTLFLSHHIVTCVLLIPDRFSAAWTSNDPGNRKKKGRQILPRLLTQQPASPQCGGPTSHPFTRSFSALSYHLPASRHNVNRKTPLCDIPSCAPSAPFAHPRSHHISYPTRPNETAFSACPKCLERALRIPTHIGSSSCSNASNPRFAFRFIRNACRLLVTFFWQGSSQT